MINFKALISDFDGTLVDTDLVPSDKVTAAITRLISNGYVFSIATGRLYSGVVKNACEKLNLQAPQIVSGGAVIIDPKTDEVLWHEYFPFNRVWELIQYFLQRHYYFSVDSNGKIFTPLGYAVKEYGSGVKFLDLDLLDYNAVAKISLEKNNGVLEFEETNLKSKYPDLSVIKSGMKGVPVLDITSAKATKHLAVLELSKILNIDQKEMIGVGNGYNDYPLFSVCGFKAAMADAPQDLKEIADIILPDVASEGLVALINKL